MFLKRNIIKTTPCSSLINCGE